MSRHSHPPQLAFRRSPRTGPGRRLLGALVDDAALDGYTAGWSHFLAWMPIVGTVILAGIYAVHRRLYYWVLLEDHPVEWLQFALLVFTVVASGLAAVRWERHGRHWLAALMLLVTLGAVALAGEEISWGQRVFSLVPSADLAAVNKQGELNLHNVNVRDVSLNTVSDVLKLLMGLGGALLALLTRPARAWLHSTWVWNVAPPLISVPGFAVMALYGAFMQVTGIRVAPVSVLQEWVELCFYVAVAITAAGCYARATRSRYRATATAVGDPLQRRLDRGVRAGRWPLVAAAIAALLLTVVFAKLTAASGILPGNVPPSLMELYQGL